MPHLLYFDSLIIIVVRITCAYKKCLIPLVTKSLRACSHMCGYSTLKAQKRGGDMRLILTRRLFWRYKTASMTTCCKKTGLQFRPSSLDRWWPTKPPQHEKEQLHFNPKRFLWISQITWFRAIPSQKRSGTSDKDPLSCAYCPCKYGSR